MADLNEQRIDAAAEALFNTILSRLVWRATPDDMRAASRAAAIAALEAAAKVHTHADYQETHG